MLSITLTLPATADEIDAIERLLGTQSTPAPSAPVSAPAKAAPAKATPKATPAPEKPAEAPAPTITEDADDEDLIGGDAPTLEDAVKAGSALVANGGSAKVKAALAVVGVKRVGSLEGEQIAAFMAELDKD